MTSTRTRHTRHTRRHAAGALERAFAAFARRHPTWAASLFDRAFLAGALAPLGGPAARPEALAEAWTRQFPYRDEATRARDVALLTPVAADLLRLLRAGARP